MRHIPAIVVRVILHSYTNQKAYVKWGNAVSDILDVSNGTSEGNICRVLVFLHPSPNQKTQETGSRLSYCRCISCICFLC